MSAVFQDHFLGLARRYADFRPRYPGALFDYLATLATRDQLVWDCACGSGQATIDLAARFETIIATDGSAQQIASAPRCDHVEYRVALADQSGLEDESIGLVTIAQALHWFNHFSSWSATNRFVEATGRDPVEPLRHNLAMVWGEPERARRVVWPLTLRVAVKPW